MGDQHKEASKFFQQIDFNYCKKASRKERGAYNDHSTVKLVGIMEYLCRLSKTPTGGIVLDPFAGSGTTALACINTGRNYTLIEKDARSYLIAKRRIVECLRISR